MVAGGLEAKDDLHSKSKTVWDIDSWLLLSISEMGNLRNPMISSFLLSSYRYKIKEKY